MMLDVILEDILPLGPANALEKYCGRVDVMLRAKDCKKIADELLDALDQLKIRDSRKRWQCFQVSLKRTWKPERIDGMARKIERFTSQLTICLVKILNYCKYTPIHRTPTNN